LIKVDLPSVVTIAISGALGYGVLVGLVKIWQITKGVNTAAS
jgi:hypothetical protein